MNKNKLIAELALQPHPEGGYFRRTYVCQQPANAAGREFQPAMTSIYYLLTDDNPIGHWHRNRSDIMHYFHCGSPLDYWLISPAGELSHHLLGNRIDAGEMPQLEVPGGYWKATELCKGDYGLLSEAVCPGFRQQDMEMACPQRLAADYPQYRDIIQRLACHHAPDEADNTK